MFWIIESILLGIGLAMDAVAVSISNGLSDSKLNKKKMIIMALAFGLFQGLMPLFGYLIGSIFKQWISASIPIIGFIILAFLGSKMIIGAVKKKDEDSSYTLGYKLLFVQAIATSIDALTAGIPYIGRDTVEVYTTFILVSVITFILCLIAVKIGKLFGKKLSNKACIFGGIILIAIGLKMIITFLIGLF